MSRELLAQSAVGVAPVLHGGFAKMWFGQPVAQRRPQEAFRAARPDADLIDGLLRRCPNRRLVDACSAGVLIIGALIGAPNRR